MKALAKAGIKYEDTKKEVKFKQKMKKAYKKGNNMWVKEGT